MKTKECETSKNLIKAFLGEASACVRYSLYSNIARKEGFIQISDIFLETSKNEEQHAKQFLKHLNEIESNLVEVSPSTVLLDTKTNLKRAFLTEQEEADITYPNFAKKALEEGFDDIGALFNKVAQVEHHHSERYKTLLKNLEENTLFKKEHDINWKCLKCGYIHFGKNPPKICPVCAHEAMYFEMLCDNF